MKSWLSIHAFFAIMLFVPFTSATAATFSWTDEHSIVHFTDDPGVIPKQFRNKIQKLDDDEPSQPFFADKEQKLLDEGVDVQQTYSGKSYDQWKKELADREAAMTAVRMRIDENADAIKNSGSNWELQKKLMAEREALLAQFKELKSGYFQWVEIARKAGLQINIEQ